MPKISNFLSNLRFIEAIEILELRQWPLCMAWLCETVIGLVLSN